MSTNRFVGALSTSTDNEQSTKVAAEEPTATTAIMATKATSKDG
jgi:hypothetical protein